VTDKEATMKPRIVNVEDVAFLKRSHGDGYACEIAPIGHEIDSRKLGFNVTVIPPGSDAAHQIVNDSSAALRYLAVSTMELPEVVESPDSGKVLVSAGTHPSRATSSETIRHITRLKNAVDYWDGE
jgi:hypothetical protein